MYDYPPNNILLLPGGHSSPTDCDQFFRPHHHFPAPFLQPCPSRPPDKNRLGGIGIAVCLRSPVRYYDNRRPSGLRGGRKPVFRPGLLSRSGEAAVANGWRSSRRAAAGASSVNLL